jgi:hypothetical protein
MYLSFQPSAMFVLLVFASGITKSCLSSEDRTKNIKFCRKYTKKLCTHITCKLKHTNMATVQNFGVTCNKFNVNRIVHLSTAPTIIIKLIIIMIQNYM